MSLENRVFGTIDEGAIEFVLYKDEYYDSLKEAMYDGFFKHECVGLGCGMDRPGAESAREEIMWFIREVVKDGISIVARDIRNGKVVGHVLNKVQVPGNPNQPSLFDKFMSDVCKSAESREMMRFIIDLEAVVNLYELYNVDTILEIMYLGVLPEYRRRSIGLLLVKYSLELAKEIQSGRASELLPVELRDTGKRLKVATAIYASNYSKRIGDVLGFKTHHEIFYDDAVFQGKTYSERIPNKLQRSSTLVSVEF